LRGKLNCIPLVHWLSHRVRLNDTDMIIPDPKPKQARNKGYFRFLNFLAIKTWLSPRTKPVKERIRFLLEKDWTIVFLLFLFFRLLYVLLGAIEASGPDPEPLSSAEALLHQDRFSHLFINVWQRWDTAWYIKIASFGYSSQDGTIAYMPLFPALVGALGVLTGNYLLSALLISTLGALAVFILLFEVARTEGLTGEKPVFTVLFLGFFPSAFFLFTAYTDSLFLAFALGAWLAGRRGRWLLAGLLAGLATLTRLQGVILTPVLALLWLEQNAGFHLLLPATWRRSLSALHAPSWLSTLLPVLSFTSWTLYLRIAGLGSAPATLLKHWGIRTVPPWTGVWLFIQRLMSNRLFFIDFVDLAVLVGVLILLILGLRRVDPALSLYAWLSLTIFFMRGTPPHLLDSFNRYLLTLFPVYLVLAKAHSRSLRVALWMGSFGLQTLLLIGFLDWRWIA
jgi:hypothetical protein